MKQSWLALLLLFGATRAASDPLQFYNGRLFIPTEVNGVRTDALLDSAAEATMVDRAFAAKAKLPKGVEQTIRGSGGTASARVVEGVTLKALGLELHPDAVVIADLAELSRRLIKRRTDVIVGRELFDAARLMIDIRRRRIAPVGTTPTPAGVRVPLTAHAGVEAIAVTVDGHPAQAEFDLGNGTEVLISRTLVNRLGLKIIGRNAGGGIGGAHERDLVRLAMLDVGGRRFRNVTAAVDDQPTADELNIGTSILKHFRITTDFKQRTVWLQATGR